MIPQRNLKLRRVDKKTLSHGPLTSFSCPSSVARISHASSWRDRRQTQHVASKDVAANNVPQGAQATRRTVRSCASSNVALVTNASPVRRHNLTVRSLPQLANCLPSRDQAQCQTRSSWPSSVATHRAMLGVGVLARSSTCMTAAAMMKVSRGDGVRRFFAAVSAKKPSAARAWASVSTY